MKPLAILALVVALCALVTPAQALDTAHWFGYTGGVSYPKGDLHDWVTHAYQMGLTYTYTMGPVFGVGGEVSYSRWTNTARMDQEALAFFGPDMQYKQSDWSYTVHAIARIPVMGPIQPYAKAGAGWFNPKAALLMADTLTATGSQNYFGHLFGAGVSCALTKNVRFNAEGSFRQYHITHTDALQRYYSGTAQLVFRMPWSTRIAN